VATDFRFAGIDGQCGLKGFAPNFEGGLSIGVSIAMLNLHTKQKPKQMAWDSERLKG
jgi:hypothetical protein